MTDATPPAAPAAPVLREQHYSIRFGDTGHSYDSIMADYLAGATKVGSKTHIFA